jgi:two-component system CheB/CheR fusion protein
MKPSSPSRLHILVADDVEVNLRVAAVLLKGLGHSGVLVQDGQQALNALAQQHFDLVMLDVSMPVLDGLSALQEIRANERQGRPHVPVILVSGHALPEDRDRFMAAGADAFIAKPIQREALQKELQRVLGR